MNGDREIVLSPTAYAQLEAELRDFERRHGKSAPSAAREAFGPQPQLVANKGDWGPPPNRKQRRAMMANARRARK